MTQGRENSKRTLYHYYHKRRELKGEETTVFNQTKKTKKLLRPITADPTAQLANQNSKQIHVTGAKRGKMRASKSLLRSVIACQNSRQFLKQ